MTKIVLNGCYGGFSLSEQGMAEYARRKGWGFYPEHTETVFSTIYWTIPENDPDRIRFNEIRNSEDEKNVDYEESHRIYDKYVMSPYEFDRTDPILVDVVESLGDKADGSCAYLYVEEVPPGTHYRISEYDGKEWLELRDSLHWEVA